MGCICTNDEDKNYKNTSFDNLTKTIREKLESINYDKNEIFDKLEERKEILKSYVKMKKIGKGLFSKVYLAVDVNSNQIAMKIIKKKNFLNKENIQKIVIEKEILKIVEHPNILKLYRTIQTNSELVFILEYAARGNFITILNQVHYLEENEVRMIVAQIAEALIHIHSKGIIYGDLKAENILINKGGVVKLCDFNLSGTSSLLNEAIQGTVNYLAPEIVLGLPRTPKSDFWSLGVFIHLIFYRRFPFKSSNQPSLFNAIVRREVEPEDVDRKASPELRSLILDLLNKNYEKRLGRSMSDFTQHKFFQKFDWAGYKDHLKDMKIVTETKCFDEDESGEENDEYEDKPTMKKTNLSSQQFLYDVKGFTLEETTNSKNSNLGNL